MLHFFGLTPEYKVELHKTICTMVTYGRGGWSWEALYYEIPVYLRNFYIAEMSKAFQNERESADRNMSKVVKREEGRTTINPPVKPSGK